MLKDWLAASLVALLTLGGVLFMVRSMAPGLLGIPVDLQMVGVSEELPPFFENVFRSEDLMSETFIIKDPLVGVRAQPLFPNMDYMGPNDILGFRNRAVPGIADVIVIGDSQTYGNNSAIQMNWPGQMSKALNTVQDTAVYNMSVGGWGAVQYFYAASNAPVFRPRVLVIAFYTGNDPLDSFKMAYNYEMWQGLIPDTELKASDAPAVNFPGLESEQWPVQFSDGVSTVFSPRLRYTSNMKHPAVTAGYAIMAEVARRIVALTRPLDIEVVFTIIPTKELVYEKKIDSENISRTQDYDLLVKAERENIEKLQLQIKSIEHAHYADVLGPLELAAMTETDLYPTTNNGHPNDNGYKIIGVSIAEHVQPLIPQAVEGFALIPTGENQFKPLYIDEFGYWDFRKGIEFERYGWNPSEAPKINQRDIARLNFAGSLSLENLEKFVPDKPRSRGAKETYP